MRKDSLKFYFISAAVFSLLLLSPSKLFEKYDERIFNSSLDIKAKRFSPAFAALEDTYLEKNESTKINSLWKESRKTFALKPASKDFRKFAPLNISPVKSQIAKNNNIDKSYLYKEEFQNKSVEEQLIELKKSRAAYSLAEHKPLAALQAERSIQDKLSERGLSLSGFNVNWASLTAANSYGSAQKNILPEKVEYREREFISLPGNSDKNGEQTYVALNRQPAREIVASSPEPSISIKTVALADTPVELVGNHKTVSGELKLDGGALHPGGDFTFFISRKFDGRTFETGAVDPFSATFEIEVAELKGFLEIELRNGSGHVLAYGERSFDRVSLKKTNLISIYPVGEESLIGRVLSYESYDDYEKPVANAKIKIPGIEGSLPADSRGYFNDSIFEQGSSFLSYFSKSKFWSTIVFGLAGKPLYPKLFSKDYVKALSSLSDQYGEKIEIESLVWGRVSYKGKPAKDIQVKVFEASYQPTLYFDHKIPAPKKKMTSSDGQFSFLNLPDGSYLLQAYKNEKLLKQRWFEVKGNHVSLGQIELLGKSDLSFIAKTFPERAKLKEESAGQIFEYGVGAPEELLTEVDSTLDLRTNPEFTLLEKTESVDTLAQTFWISTKSKNLELKVATRDWLNALINKSKKEWNQTRGIILGFLEGDEFEVLLDYSKLGSKDAQVIYFNKDGELTDRGSESGGFIIINVPSGLRSVLISPDGTSKILSQLVMVQDSKLGTFSYTFK